MRTVKDNSLIITDGNGRHLLSIREELEAQTALLELDGAITIDIAHDFEDELISLVTVCDSVILDFARVTGICSQGLRVLLNIQKILDKRVNGSLLLRNLGQEVDAIFKELGFDGLFEIQT